MALPAGNNKVLNIRLAIMAVSLSLVSGCTEPAGESATLDQAPNPTTKEATTDAIRNASSEDTDIETILRRAEAAYESATASQHSWIVTRKLIGSARQALQAGDAKKAMVDARRALFTAEASVVQASEEKKNWLDRVPR